MVGTSEFESPTSTMSRYRKHISTRFIHFQKTHLKPYIYWICCATHQ